VLGLLFLAWLACMGFAVAGGELGVDYLAFAALHLAFAWYVMQLKKTQPAGRPSSGCRRA